MGLFSHKTQACQPGELLDYLAAADRPVLVEFSERDSPACQMEEPVLQKLLHRYAGRLAVTKADVGQSIEDAARFKISAVPTFVLFAGGEERIRLVGFQSIEDLTAALDAALPPQPPPPQPPPLD